MGNGPSETPDPRKLSPSKPKPDPYLDDEIEGSVFASELGGVDGASGGSFCERPQVAEFRASRAIEPGLRLRLVIGHPPSVRTASGQLVGELVGQSAAAMRHCLEFEYEMEGNLTVGLTAGEVGRLIVKGVRR
jgi:hypothetical protein